MFFLSSLVLVLRCKDVQRTEQTHNAYANTRMQNKDESCRWTLSMNNESSEKERSSNHQTRSQQATLREGFVFIHPISTKKFL